MKSKASILREYALEFGNKNSKFPNIILTKCTEKFTYWCMSKFAKLLLIEIEKQLPPLEKDSDNLERKGMEKAINIVKFQLEQYESL